MSDVGERMLFELRRIREALEGSQPLGFGKKVGPTYVFVRHHEVGGETCFWYSRVNNKAKTSLSVNVT